MKLPNAEQATIPSNKILGYLLSETHPRGKDKAAFFFHFGFTSEEWQKMENALLQHAINNDVISSLKTSEGIHYVVEGTLESPDGRNPSIRTIWAIDADAVNPRLITAYPVKNHPGGK